jgi:hypothetical protein
VFLCTRLCQQDGCILALVIYLVSLNYIIGRQDGRSSYSVMLDRILCNKLGKQCGCHFLKKMDCRFEKRREMSHSI